MMHAPPSAFLGNTPTDQALDEVARYRAAKRAEQQVEVEIAKFLVEKFRSRI